MDYGLSTCTGQRLMERIRKGQIRITWHSWSLEWTVVFGMEGLSERLWIMPGLWIGNGEQCLDFLCTDSDNRDGIVAVGGRTTFPLFYKTTTTSYRSSSSNQMQSIKTPTYIYYYTVIYDILESLWPDKSYSPSDLPVLYTSLS